MRIAARFPGTCPTCSLPIAMGDHVEWTKGSPAKHSSCPVASAPASKPAAPVARRPFRHTKCIVCGVSEGRRNARGYLDGDPIYKSGECRSCYEERKMGY